MHHTLLDYPTDRKQPDQEKDNIRVYIPLDINGIIFQVEIYDQIWHVREYKENMRFK